MSDNWDDDAPSSAPEDQQQRDALPVVDQVKALREAVEAAKKRRYEAALALREANRLGDV